MALGSAIYVQRPQNTSSISIVAQHKRTGKRSFQTIKQLISLLLIATYFPYLISAINTASNSVCYEKQGESPLHPKPECSTIFDAAKTPFTYNETHHFSFVKFKNNLHLYQEKFISKFVSDADKESKKLATLLSQNGILEIDPLQFSSSNALHRERIFDFVSTRSEDDKMSSCYLIAQNLIKHSFFNTYKLSFMKGLRYILQDEQSVWVGFRSIYRVDDFFFMNPKGRVSFFAFLNSISPEISKILPHMQLKFSINFFQKKHIVMPLLSTSLSMNNRSMPTSPVKSQQ